MTRYKCANELTVAAAAYIAGLVDGEGTVTLTRKHANENRQLAVSISSTEIQLLEYVLASTGVGKITNKRRSKPHHSDSYAYAVYNRQALQLIQQIAPHLKSYKAARSQLALKHYLQTTPRNGKYTADIRRRKARFEEEFFQIVP